MTNVSEKVEGVVPAVVEQLECQLAEGREVCGELVAWLMEKGLDFLFNALSAAVILFVGWLAIKLIVAAVRKAISSNGRKQKLLVDLVGNALSKICWTVLVVVILGRLGVNVGPIVAGLGVTGFILGFAFQETLGNLASGLMIAAVRDFAASGKPIIIMGEKL